MNSAHCLATHVVIPPLRLRAFIFAAAMALSTLTGVAQENMFWRSSGGGEFQSAANWSAFQGHTMPSQGTLQDPLEPNMPESNRRAVFELLSNGTITFTGSATTADAQVLKGSAFFALGGNTWNTGMSFSILAPFINPDGNGPEAPPYTGVSASATVSGGTLNTTSLLVGAGHNLNVGTLTLSDATLNSANLTIAQNGTGTLNLTNGSLLTTTPASNSAVPIGGQGGSHGTVNVSGGSTWNVGANGVLHVGGFGGSGSGTLNITSGTVSGGTFNVAMNSGITGTVYVNGGSAQLSMSNGISIGQGGTGVMNLSNGGEVFSPTGTFSNVGNSGGGSGSVSLTGAGSSWTAGALTLSRASSNITVSSGGLLDTRELFMVQNNADLDIQATGNLEAATLQVWQGGTAHLSGTVRANVITVDGAGSAVFQTNDNVTIDNGAGVGVLNITNGGAYHGAPRIGLGTGAAIGTANISGNGSLWNIGTSYTIGAGGGLGTANVSQGAAVTSGDLFIGRTSNGVVEIQHNGTQWSGSGAAYVGGSDTAAADGGITGRLTVQNGGTANFTGQVKVWAGGTVQVFGGSSLSAGSIHVAGGAFQGDGSVFNAGALTVTGGGSYTTSNLNAGGNISVSGSGSTIDAEQVEVQSGRILTIGSGGSLSANNITLNGGELQNSGSLLSGGSLTVNSGGLYNSTTALEIGGMSFGNASVSGAGSEIHASNVNVRSGGVLTVSSGGSVTNPVNVFGGTTNGGFGGNVEFQNASAGSGVFTTGGGTATNANGGNVQFNGSATASSSSFATSGGTASGAYGGNVQFNHGATAGSGSFTTSGGTVSGAFGGNVQFNDSATAGGTFTTGGGSFSGASGGNVQFNQSATAGNAAFITHGGSVSGAYGANVQFNEFTNAGSATFTSHGAAVSNASGGNVQFNQNATAGSAVFTINGGTVSDAEGAEVEFNGTSSAGSGSFTIHAGTSAGAFNASVEFHDNASAGHGTFINNGSAFTGSLINGTAGAVTLFHNNSTAGNATLTAQGGTSGGSGAAIAFFDDSDGAEARVIVNGNGRLDISLHAAGEVSVGSIEGTGNVFLGSNTLAIGGNGLSTTFTGVVQDDGIVFDETATHALGGALIKDGGGTTTLTGVNTYTGMTAVGGGTLVADLSLNASVLNSVSALHVGGGTFELKGLSATTRTQILNGLTVHEGRSTVAVNNTGTSTTLDLTGTGGTLGITRMDGGAVDFTATTGTLGTDAIIKTTQANDASGILGAWATVNGGAALAANNGANVIVAYAGYDDVSSTIANSSTSNTRISSGGGVVALGAATTSINTLTQNHSTAATVDTAGKTLSTGGILVSPAAAALTIGTTAGSGTLTATDELVLANHSSSTLTINANVTGGIAMTTSGSTTLTGTNTYTGATNVAAGTLVVDGSIAASLSVNIAHGAMLSGHGSVSTIGGAGTVAPGNSPGIMTATAIDPNDGIDFSFQFTQLGAPNFLSPSASGNDLLRLSSLTPFTSALSQDNTITLDFSGLTLNNGDILLGGFYADNGGDFFAQIEHADFEFIGLGLEQEIMVSTVQHTANFGSGNVTGYITKFTLTAIGATLTPASISDSATAILHVTGLDVGETVLIERIVDQNGNGSIDAGEPLAEVFSLTDGQVTSIAGVRNTHIPGDEDLTADGDIDFHVTPARGSELGRIAGTHILRISSPTADFDAFTRTLTLTNPAQPQTITGTVTDGTNPVPHACVLLLDPASDGEFVIGVIANAAGQFSVSAPVGSHMLFAVKPGFVADFNTLPVVVLGADATVVQNVTLITATTSISGTVVDSSNAAGLGCVQFFVESESGLATLISTNLNGTYSVPVTAGTWVVENSNSSTDRLGYLSPQNNFTADATGGAVSNANLSFTKVTALIHGTVTNNSAQPLAGLQIGSDEGNNTYFADTTTDAAGHYLLGVTTGSWNVYVTNDSPGIGGYILPGSQNISITGPQALQADFSLTTVTAHIQGVVTNNGSAVANIEVGAYNDATDQFISTFTAPDGTFDLGLVAGTWSVQIESRAAAAFNIVSPVLEHTLITNQTLSGITLAIQSATAQINGFVRDSGSAPINTFVYASATISSVFYAAYTQTDGSGNYSFPVINGTWTVGVESTGDFTQPLPVNVVISGANATQNFTLTKFPVITSQPGNQTVTSGQTFVFSIDANSGSTMNFQWQVSTDSGFSWNPLTNDATYSNVASPMLNVTASLGLNGYRYRCNATNTFGTTTSDIVQLTVNALTAAGSWRQQYFGTSANTGNAADTATPDGDDIANLLKYALVITPGSSGATAMPAAQRVSDRLTLIFTRDPARNDATLIVEANNTLTGTWTTLATSVNGAAFTGSGTIIETDASGGRKTVEVRDTVPISGAGARFMRIQVTR